MSNRPRKPDRAGFFTEVAPTESLREEAPGPHHTISPPPIDSSEADRPAEVTDLPGPIEDETKKLARTIRELIQSLPRRQINSARGIIESAAHAIAGAIAPTFEDQSPVARRIDAEDGFREGESNSSLQGSSGPSAPGEYGGTTVLPDPGASERREEVASIPSVVALLGDAYGDPDGNPTANPWPDPAEVTINGPIPGDRARSLDARGEGAAEWTHPPLADSSSVTLAAATIAGNVDLYADLGRRIYHPDRAVNVPIVQGVGSSFGAIPKMVAVGPVGPTGRLHEGLDRASSESGPSMSSVELPDADSTGGRRGATPTKDDGSTGVDLSPTNALLGQILDELRRQQQPARIVSGRSVYPER